VLRATGLRVQGEKYTEGSFSRSNTR
jgi:hypothetical protein